VRNLDDGGVEVEPEGEGEALARFEARLRRGPVGARVDAIEIDALTPTGRRGRFVVSI
jgi:acylphosphatase